jgi:hypothetical protein
MENQLRTWNEPTPVGGLWDWDRGVLGIGAGVTLINSNATDNVLERIDAILDDGNLSRWTISETRKRSHPDPGTVGTAHRLIFPGSMRPYADDRKR